jgi:hypothetical protein
MQAKEAYSGNGGKAPFILNLNQIEVVSVTAGPLYSQTKWQRYPLNGRLGELRTGLGFFKMS